MSGLSPIYVTSAPNDKDLLHHLGSLAQVHQIEAGDINFLGLWENGEQVWVWGERKKLSDLVNCVLDSGRFLRQIQDAHAAGFKFFFSIIEAMYRANPQTGLLEYRRGKNWTTYHINPKNTTSPTVDFKRIEDYLNEISFYLGVRVFHTLSVRETAQKVINLYHLFQRAPEDHNSLKQFASTPGPVAAYLVKPSLIRRVAKELPHIGWDRSWEFEREFGSLREMCRVIGDGDTRRLMELEGIGKKIAEDIILASEVDESG